MCEAEKQIETKGNRARDNRIPCSPNAPVNAMQAVKLFDSCKRILSRVAALRNLHPLGQVQSEVEERNVTLKNTKDEEYNEKGGWEQQR